MIAIVLKATNLSYKWNSRLCSPSCLCLLPLPICLLYEWWIMYLKVETKSGWTMVYSCALAISPQRSSISCSSNSKHVPHSFNVIRWLLSGSHDSKNGAIQCSNDINGARIGNNSCNDTERSCGCPSKSHHFQMAALVQRRVRLFSASCCNSLNFSGNSLLLAKSDITLKSQSRIRRGKSLISLSLHSYYMWKKNKQKASATMRRIHLGGESVKKSYRHFLAFAIIVDVYVF